MDNLQITAYLSSPIAVSDNWTPQLDGLLIYYYLDQLGQLAPNPTVEQVNLADVSGLPIAQHDLGFYYCSAPIYNYTSEQQSRFRKRWTPDQDANINWGKRRAKFSTSEGAEKSYDLPLFIRLADKITWYCVGDNIQIEQLLSLAKGIGKKRSQGFGQVYKWDVDKIDNNWSIIKDCQLMKPLPVNICSQLSIDKTQYNILKWGWKPPVWLVENQSLCYMPKVVNEW